TDTDAEVVNGSRNWGAGFMPAVYQGSRFRPGDEPIAFLKTPEGIAPQRQRAKLDFLAQLNQRHAAQRPDNSELEARIRSYELAFRMQAEAPVAIDLKSESEATRQLYGLDNKETETFGRQCLLARRLSERGVRFVQLYHGAGSKWDSHDNIEPAHSKLCRAVDKPIAGLLRDLKARGLLDETLVVAVGEFGRSPEKGVSTSGNGNDADGRDHWPYCYTSVVAGAGIKRGYVHGESDKTGSAPLESPVHPSELLATIYHAFGIDPETIVYNHLNQPRELVKAKAVTELFG
ncbi:MAG: DUF1501 domain-containing protein, partial [Verrucomicrobiales bacterium]